MKTRVIIDCDPGSDDAQAILMALAHKDDITVVAVTTVVGNTTVDNTTRNAVRILKFANRLDIPVYRGCRWSLIGDQSPHQDSDGFMGKDGLGDVIIDGVDPVDTTVVKSEPAAVALCRLVSEDPGSITLMAIGPLTNLSTALSLDSEFGSKLKDCIIMGGNTSGRGNITWSAEFNFWSDPEAAHCVLGRLGTMITLLTLETCHQYSFTWEWYDELVSTPTRTAAFIKSIDSYVVNKLRGRGQEKYLAWDQVAMAVLLRPNVVLESKLVYATVELQGKLTRGQMVVHWLDSGETPESATKPFNIRLVQTIDPKIYSDLIHATVRYDFSN